MSETANFDYDRFIATQDISLFQIMNPILYGSTSPVAKEIIQRLISEFTQYDTGHLVYAIALCSSQGPALVAPHLPELLQHEDYSVYWAATRALLNLPNNCVDVALISKVRDVVANLSDRKASNAVNTLSSLEHKLNEKCSNSSNG